MSNYRVCIIKMNSDAVTNYIKFDNKEDAEHYAKNESSADYKHIYEVQKNNEGDFVRIKSYLNGKEE